MDYLFKNLKKVIYEKVIYFSSNMFFVLFFNIILVIKRLKNNLESIFKKEYGIKWMP